jgi:hypothetical protein
MTDYSLRDLARFMDPVSPATSLRELGKMYRWADASPGTLSLKEMGRRQAGAKGVRIRLLFYNTYLLPGFQVAYGAAAGAIAAGPLGALIGLGTDLLGWTRKRIGEKPAREKRATEIGIALQQLGYDLIALCEVFEHDDRVRILKGLAKPVQPWNLAVGPGKSASRPGASSGLFTISPAFVLQGTRTHTYRVRGSRARDADWWAAKGVLRTVVPLGSGLGMIELYSTHLFAGGGLAGDPPEREKARVQERQLDELMAFYRRTHEPPNIAVVLGDFNIPAHEPDRYRGLVDRLRQEGLEDIWASRNGTWGETSELDGEENGHYGELICPLDGDQRCIDEPARDRRSARIDYVFVQRPTAEHGAVLELTRPRRVPFKRPARSDGMTYMSDHIGIETTLSIVPA